MSASPVPREKDPIRPWFEAVESMGDYTTFRLGHLKPGTSEVRWHDIPHQLYDGIGSMAHLLREAGIKAPPLQQINHPSLPSWWPFFRALPVMLGPRHRLKWKRLEQGPPVSPGPLPHPAYDFHVFEVDETERIRVLARKRGVTVNSFLLKHLDTTLRGDLEDPDADLPWMVPVNLRGKINRSRDTSNHSSYLALKVARAGTVQDLHHDIYRRLDRGEHWIAWKGYSATSWLPRALKRLALRTDRAMTQWNLGLFTNLGVIDPKKTVTHEDYRGPWILLATVLRGQMVGAGCLTFQGRLSISLQVHPDLTTSPAVPKRWMAAWRERIDADLAAPAHSPAPHESPAA